MHRFARRLALGSMTIAAALAMATAPATAQHGSFITIEEAGGAAHSFGPGRLVTVLRPDFTRRDAGTLNEALGLDESQQYILNVLITDYEKGFETASAELREALGKSMPHMMPQIAGGLPFGDPDDVAFGGIAEEMLDHLREHLGNGNAVFIANDGGGAVEVHALQIDGDGPVTIEMEAGGDAEGGEGGEGEEGGEGISQHIVVGMALRVDDAGEGEVMSEDVDIDFGEAQVDAIGDVLFEAAELEIPDEVREEIEKVLQDRLARITERLEQRMKERAVLDERLEQIRQQAIEAEAERVPPEEVVALAHHLKMLKTQLREEFVADLTTVLSPDQTERMDAAMRLVNRRNALPRGVYGGESLDVNQLLRDAPVTSIDPATLETLLADYATAIDEALVARDTHLLDSEIDRFQAFYADDQDRVSALMLADAAKHVAVRDVNDQFVEALTSALANDEEAVALLLAADERAFPRVFRPTHAQRLFREVLKEAELEDEMRTEVEALRDLHAAELSPLNDAIVTAIRVDEPTQTRRMVEMAAAMREGGFGGLPEPSPVALAFGERSQFDASYVQKLESLVGEELVRGLPSGRPRQIRMGGPGGTRIRSIRMGGEPPAAARDQ